MSRPTRTHLIAGICAAGAAVLVAAPALAEQISFTQTASGGASRLLENRAPDVASRTDGASLPPIAGSVTRTQTGRVGMNVDTTSFSATSPVTRTLDLATATRKDGLLVERRITATVNRSYAGTVFPNPSAGVGTPATVSELEEIFFLSAPGIGLASSSIAQTPFRWQCSGGPCAPSIGFAGTSPSFVLQDIKTYDPGRFDPKNPEAPGTFVDMGGGQVGLKYTSFQTTYPGNTTFANASVAADIVVEQVFRPWKTHEALDIAPSADRSGMTALVTPRFGFTTSEAAALGGYGGFNWVQRITDMEAGGRRLTTDAERIAEFGRGLGIDPLPGGNPGGTADLSTLYWDLAPMPGRGGYDAASNANDLVVTFSDLPQLFEAGRKVYFETTLVAMKGGDAYDTLPDDRFTFRWSFEQTTDVTWTRELLDALGLLEAPTGGIAAMLQNVDPRFAGTGIYTFLGFGRAEDVVDPAVPVPSPAAGWILCAGALALFLRRRPAARPR